MNRNSTSVELYSFCLNVPIIDPAFGVVICTLAERNEVKYVSDIFVHRIVDAIALYSRDKGPAYMLAKALAHIGYIDVVVIKSLVLRGDHNMTRWAIAYLGYLRGSSVALYLLEELLGLVDGTFYHYIFAAIGQLRSAEGVDFLIINALKYGVLEREVIARALRISPVITPRLKEVVPSWLLIENNEQILCHLRLLNERIIENKAADGEAADVTS